MRPFDYLRPSSLEEASQLLSSEDIPSYPLAGGTDLLVRIRTGAAGGVAVKYLSRGDSSTIGMIGAGRQARTQLMAIKEAIPSIKEVKVFDKQEDASLKYANDMARELKLSIHAVRSVEEATQSDIVVTTTPAREPIIPGCPPE